ncbi:MAG: type II toxin-antitoxin system VapC family toxin [Candidatus Hodarchaeota archaeon]
MSTKEKRHAIDSNVYRDVRFINFMKKNKDLFDIYIPSVVYLEVGYFFLNRGISIKGYEKDIRKFNGKVLKWDSIDTKLVLEYAFGEKAVLPFRDHFRDFLIGAQCIKEKIDLITYNTRHFAWCKGIKIITPREFTKNYRSWKTS